MGRKVSQESLKISKDNHQKHQFNSLINVLRPKVYITDSSSFKKLVQELTGNGSPTTLSPPSLEPNMVDNCTLNIGTEEAHQTHRQSDPQTSPDEVSISPDATSNSPDELYFYDALMMNEEFNQVCNQLCLDDLAFQQDTLTNQSIDNFLAYQNLESLLLDVEPNPLYSCYEQMVQPDVSIYDYELSGIL